MASHRWLSKRKAVEVLARLAETMAIPSLHLALFDADGRLLAALPADDVSHQWDSIAARIGQIQEETITAEGVLLPLTAHRDRAGVLAAQTDDGWPAGALAALRAARTALGWLAEAEMEKRALAQETLDRYREINLLYRIGETIGAAVDLDEVTDLVLLESMNTIRVSKGLVMLVDQGAGDLVVKASQGPGMARGERWPLGQGILGEVARGGKPYIVNDTAGDPRAHAEAPFFGSLLCVPLQARGQVLGVLALSDKVPEAGAVSSPTLSDPHGPPGMFTASDQNLLIALASQAAVAIDTALEVQAREERLRQQIRDLRIEIDHVKKARQVAEITESEYFQQLRAQAHRLRGRSGQD